MWRLLVKRLLLGALTLIAVSIVIFAGTEVLPGDIATAILGQSATPDTVEALRQSLGLHDPAPERYLRWLWGFLGGDFGVSLASGRSIAEQLDFRLGNTLFLASLAAAVAVPVAVVLGLVAAIRENRVFDRLANITTLAMISVPEFLIGYLMVLFFSVKLGWLPSLSFVFPGMGFAQRLEAALLPALTLTMVVLAHIMRMTRATVLGVLSTSFVETAYLKGLSTWRVVARHALPNVIGPIANVVVLNLAYLVVGVVVVEVVFVYPGMGQLMVNAVSQRDLPVVQACGLIFAGTYVALNLLADVLSILGNPRLRYPR